MPASKSWRMLKSGRAILEYPFRLASTDTGIFGLCPRTPPEVSAGFLPADTKVRVWNERGYRGDVRQTQAPCRLAARRAAISAPWSWPQLALRHPDAPENRDYLLAAALYRTQPHRAVALETGYVIVWRRCLRRPLVGRTLDAELRR